MYLLDTNVVSELGGRRRPANAEVANWVAAIPIALFHLSVISLTELEVGVLRLERQDVRQGAILRRWLEEFVLPTFDGRVLDVDERVARRCAELHIPDPRPIHDAFIAATALVHKLAVVTRNVSDFAATGVAIINPWDGS